MIIRRFIVLSGRWLVLTDKSDMDWSGGESMNYCVFELEKSVVFQISQNLGNNLGFRAKKCNMQRIETAQVNTFLENY